MSKKQTDFQCPQAAVLAERLAESHRFIQVVAGPCQVGKSTLVRQVTAELGMTVRCGDPQVQTFEWKYEGLEQWQADQFVNSLNPRPLNIIGTHFSDRAARVFGCFALET